MNMEGLPGDMYAPNITPDKETGIGGWTTVRKSARYARGFQKRPHAVPLDAISKLPVLERYRCAVPGGVYGRAAAGSQLCSRSNVAFFVSLMVKGVPTPVGARGIPDVDPDGGEIYGEYLVSVAGCEVCHTQEKRGQVDPAMRFAGGRVFKTPNGSVVSANITPDKDTGIGKWDFIRFRDRIHGYKRYPELPKVGPERFTVMPWIAYDGLTDHDLEACCFTSSHAGRSRILSCRILGSLK